MSTPATFAARWDEAVAARGPEPFLVYLGSDERTTTWTYAGYDAVVDRVVGRLAGHGVGPGDAVHLALRSSPSFVAAWLAVARLGAWMVPSDPEATPAELAGHLARTRPAVGICGIERASIYAEAVAQSGVDLATIAVDEDDPEPPALLAPWAAHGAPGAMGVPGGPGVPGVPDAPAVPGAPDVRGASGAPGAGGGWGAVRPGPYDRLAVLFTSGTTSAPKGVELTQANYAFAGDVMAAAAALRPDDRQLVVLPLFHANAQYYSFASAISAGASVALVHRFSASRFLAQAAALRATCASLFAAPIRMILARGARPVDGLRLRHCWFAQNLTADQYEQFAGLLGCRPRQLYGMTETLPAVVTDRPLAPRPDAMGYPTLGCEVRVHEGELQVRGVPGETLFAGYLDDPATTEACVERLPDGSVWFTTGDRARIDPGDGRLVFGGRRSDVLKVAGENVSTVEVEAVLAEHPAVLEVAVVGRPDPVRDEVPVAFVVPVPGRAPDQAPGDLPGDQVPGDRSGDLQGEAPGDLPGELPERLMAFAAERLAKAKRPREIHVVDALPRTSVGKIRKFLLPTGPTGGSA